MGGYTPHQTASYLIICATIPPFVFLVTMFRLWLKGRARWWWDDAFATIGITTMITQQGLLWGSGATVPNHGIPLGIFYSVVICTFLQVFCARLAILVSVIRISPNTRTRVLSQWIGVLFVFLFLLLVAQLIWVCETNLEYIPQLHMPACNFTKQVPILQFIVAMIADSFLIFIPLRTLRFLSPKSQLRNRLMFIFAASICTTLASLVQSILNILNLTFAVLVAASLEAWVSLLVCNVGVVVTAISKCRPSNTSVLESTNASQSPIQFDISVLQFSPTSRSGANQTEPGILDSSISFVTQPSQQTSSLPNEEDKLGQYETRVTETKTVLEIK